MTKYLILAGLMLAGCTTATADDHDQLQDRMALAQETWLSWLEGHWRSESEGRVSEEIWTNGEGGLYLGVNRSIRNGQARGFEFLRIVVTDELAATYCAQPGGGEAVCFESVLGGSTTNAETGEASGTITFINETHDFPQQIIYVREGDTLTATISDLAGEQSMTFSWTRVSD